MVTKAKKAAFKLEDVKPYLAKPIRYSPIWAPIVLCLLFILFLGWPVLQKISKFNREIQEKQNSMSMVDRSSFDIQKTKTELEQFKLKVEEFEKRLPTRLKDKLILETLQEITRQLVLKVPSLKQDPFKKYTLEETKDVFVESPFTLRLKCGYYELIDFLEKIEKADQLMKVTNLTVRAESGSDWEHAVEFSISAFSKGESNE